MLGFCSHRPSPSPSNPIQPTNPGRLLQNIPSRNRRIAPTERQGGIVGPLPRRTDCQVSGSGRVEENEPLLRPLAALFDGDCGAGGIGGYPVAKRIKKKRAGFNLV